MNGKWIALVAVIVVVAAAVAGFGGYSYGRNVGQAQALAARQRFFADRGIGGGQGNGQGGAQTGLNSANFATGQVKQVSGNTIDLSTATEVLKVNVSNTTQIQKMGQASLTDIQPGEQVVVQGTRAADGTFTARSIQVGRGGFPRGGNGGNGSNGGSAAGAASNTNQ